MTLYQVLGVAPTATTEEINAAFRALAKRYHPDRNVGDPEAEVRYKALVHAHGILMDASERAHYDQCGEGGRPAPHVGMAGCLFEVWTGVVEGLLKNGAELAHENVIKTMKANLYAGQREKKVALDKLQQKYKKVARAVERIVDPEGFLNGVATNHLQQIQAEIAHLEAEMQHMTLALAYLDACRYEVSPREGGFYAGPTLDMWTLFGGKG